VNSVEKRFILEVNAFASLAADKICFSLAQERTAANLVVFAVRKCVNAHPLLWCHRASVYRQAPDLLLVIGSAGDRAAYLRPTGGWISPISITIVITTPNHSNTAAKYLEQIAREVG